jgi:hypothetical protein
LYIIRAALAGVSPLKYSTLLLNGVAISAFQASPRNVIGASQIEPSDFSVNVALSGPARRASFSITSRR